MRVWKLGLRVEIKSKSQVIKIEHDDKDQDYHIPKSSSTS
uniref:Uncharacterized protein n=1 Tax=Arundo donax TaxID=35708 RepID=A0A0A9AGI4_ARUDO